ncbi:MAG: VCBS repeat-containing protein, partial [Phycisphaerales bacterium]|nr:VCBS repeat-containing protein [Phycisphaerales bacterium]
MTPLLLLAMAFTGALEPDVHMRDVTSTSGIAFTATCGTLPTNEILEANGGGMALLDFDRDGDLDLFIANGATLNDPEHGPGCRLYENQSTNEAIRFTDATDSSGIAITRWAMGAAAGDFDGDGHVDLYVTCHGPNVLLRNLGDGTFQDVTDHAGVAGNEWSTSAAFGDLDADGDLDLFVVNYLEFDPEHPPARSQYKGNPVMGGPHGLPATPDVLYENLGDGSFRNTTERNGVGAAAPAFGLNLAILDMNDDGLLDVFVGNDSMPNHLFLQDATDTGMRLQEHGQHRGVASNMDGHDQATMGVAIADVNGDARPDIFTTNFSSDTNTLHIAAPDGLWDDRTSAMGLGLASRRMLGWASAFADLDHDGDEDLLMVNGHVYPQATLETMDSQYMQ